jgi:hypothetical protein
MILAKSVTAIDKIIIFISKINYIFVLTKARSKVKIWLFCYSFVTDTCKNRAFFIHNQHVISSCMLLSALEVVRIYPYSQQVSPHYYEHLLFILDCTFEISHVSRVKI